MLLSSISPSAPTLKPNKIYNDYLREFGIKSVLCISEATFIPKIIIHHFDGREFYYPINIQNIQEIQNGKYTFEEFIEKLLNKHIKKECIVFIRKKKLQTLNNK